MRRRPHGFLPVAVIRNPAVVRSALAAGAVPAAWFALLIAVPAVLVGRGWEPWLVGVALLPSAATGLLAPAGRRAAARPGRAGPVAGAGRGDRRRGAGRSRRSAPSGSAVLLVLAVVAVTLAFGLGQPALMAAVGDAVSDDVRGVALGVATLFFLVGGGVGSAVVGGLGDVLGMPARCCCSPPCRSPGSWRCSRSCAGHRWPSSPTDPHASTDRPRADVCEVTPT